MKDKNLVKFINKTSYEFCSVTDHQLQGGSNWHKFPVSNLFKRYVKGEICLCIKLRNRAIKGEGEYLRAFFGINNTAWGAEDHFERLDRTNAKAGKFTFLDSNGFVDSRGCDEQYQEPMFINDVEFMDGSENMLVRRGAIVGLYGLYECCGTIADALYFSPTNGIFEFIWVPTHGEPKISLGDIPVIVTDQRYNQVIEARSKLMDNLTRKDGESDWWWGAIPLKNIFCAIEIHSSDDTIRARITNKELVNLGIEIAETFFGPTNLEKNSE